MNVPRTTSYYRRRKNDPEYLRKRREYTRLYRETHPESPAQELFDRAYHVGCALCGERAKECLDVYPFGAKKPLTIRTSVLRVITIAELVEMLEAAVCLCANCWAKYRHGTVGLPHWVPEEYRWR